MAAPAVTYEVRWREAGSNTAWRSQRFPANSTVITIPGLTRGRTYEGDARSIGAMGETSLWVPVTFSVGMPSYVPKPPENMVVLPAPNGVNISWEVYDGNRPDTIYVIERRPPGGEWEPVGQTPGNSMYVPLDDDTAYEWRVYAKDWQEMLSDFTDAVTRARQHVADMEDLAQETADRIQGDADEAAARAAGLAAEALARASGLLDLEIELDAKITNESVLRETGDENLASMIANISAGSGEQFDAEVIWYFDTNVEGWTAAVSGSAPTASTGFMKPADNSVPGGVASPVFDGDGAVYRTTKLRLKQTGNPNWQGYVWWQTDADATYTTGKRVSMPEPTWDASGVATMDFKDIPWAADVNRIRVDLTSTQDASNYIEFDWIAVGRPSPGASMAALQAEQTARITGDQAEATARLALASQMRGNYTGNNLALVTTGLLADEKSARTTADSAEVTARTALSTKVTGLADPSGATLPTLSSGLIFDEKTARTTADSAMASDITSLQVRLDDAEGDISGQASALGTLTTRVTANENNIESQGQAITDLDARVDDAENDISGQASALGALDTRVTTAEGSITANSTQITSLNSSVTTLVGQVNELPGDNVLQNSSFDGATVVIGAGVRPQYWSAQLGGTGTGTGFVSSVVDSTMLGSTKALRMEASSLATTRYMELPGNTAELGARYKITPGKKHTLSVWARGSAGNNIQIFIQYFNAAGTIVATNSMPQTPITADWTRYFVTGNAAPNDALTANVYAIRMYGRTGEPAAWVEVDNVQLQQGAVPNNYVPSVTVLATATATALQNLDTRTTANADAITAQALAITALNVQVNSSNPNTFPNPSGEFGTTGWNQSGPTLSTTNNPAYGPYYYVQSLTASTAVYSYDLVSGPGTYTVSMEGFVAAGQAGYYLDVLCFNASGGALLDSPNLNFVAGDAWVRRSITVTAPAGTAKISVRIVTVGVSTEIRWRRIKFELGSVATPYNSENAVKVAGSATQTLDTRVTATEAGVSSNSSAITSLNSQMGSKANVSAVTALETSVTALKTAGDGGGNILVNSTFAANIVGCGLGWNEPGTAYQIQRDMAGDTWRPPGVHNFGFHADGAPPANKHWMFFICAPNNGAYTGYLPVKPGKRYCMSGYVAAHRCQVGVGMKFVDDPIVNNLAEPTDIQVGMTGGGDIRNWRRSFLFFTAPTNARWVMPQLWIRTTGEDNPYAWIVMPQLEEVDADQTAPSEYGSSGIEMFASYTVALDVNGYASGFQSYNNGTISSFNVLASSFAVLNPAGGARTEYSGGNWRVYDGAGALRVRLGVW